MSSIEKKRLKNLKQIVSSFNLILVRSIQLLRRISSALEVFWTDFGFTE